MKRFDHSSIAFLRVGMLLVGLALFAPGCGGGGATADAAPVDTSPSMEAAPPTPFCTTKSAAAGVTDLSGTWVARIAGAQIVNALGAQMHNQVILHLLVTISQQGEVVVADGRYCDRAQISLDPSPIIKVSIPDAWAHFPTSVHRTGTFAVGTEGVPVLTFTPIREAFGAVLASPTDTLPTSATDANVIDEDGDGSPGITVVVTGVTSGTLFAVQLQTTAISAIAVAPDRVEGALTFTSEQNVLGSVPSTLATLYALGSSGADPVVCNSGFVMVKLTQSLDLDAGAVDGGQSVDGGVSACEWVRANEAALFP
jgi:hypothetical protein